MATKEPLFHPAVTDQNKNVEPEIAMLQVKKTKYRRTIIIAAIVVNLIVYLIDPYLFVWIFLMIIFRLIVIPMLVLARVPCNWR